MAAKKKIYCRFEGCKHKGFTSRAGRLYHEKKFHGHGFLDTNTTKPTNTKTPEPSEINQTLKEPTVDPVNNQFIKIEEVKFNMAKNTQKPKSDGSIEYENECGKCGYEYNGTAKFCPGCGVEFE